MPQLRLDFLGWSRSGIYAVVPTTTLTDGRLTGRVDITLRNEQPPNEVAVEQIQFDLLGPGDVGGLKSGAVRTMMPPPGTVDFEETKCAYVELSSPDLPWRYTPELAIGRRLRPWLALVVAKPGAGEVTLDPGGSVTLTAPALQAHDLATSARWAHVQDDADQPGRPVARLLSPRNLDAETDYLAVLVPAFTAVGGATWSTGTASVNLPVHHWWSFRTAAAGDFPTLAARLVPIDADDTLGRAPLVYTPLPADPELFVRGALGPIGGTDADVPTAVVDDIELLTEPVVDPRRPVVGLAVYGDAWVADPVATTWGGVFRQDPRHRAVGGLGLAMGIDEQDLLADAAARQAGALAAAAQRIRDLVTGLGAARSLWTRRLPVDPLRQLALFGPALGRIMTATGTVLSRATGPDRPLPAAVFSSAARRVLRPGPARTTWAAAGATDPAAVLEQANRCPPPPPRVLDGAVHTDAAAGAFGIEPLDKLLEGSIGAEHVPFEHLRRLYEDFDRTPYGDDTLASFDSIVGHWVKEAEQGRPVPVLGLLAVLDPPTPKRPDDTELQHLLRLLGPDRGVEPDGKDLIAVATAVVTAPPDRPCRPVDLPTLATGVADAIDPTVLRPFVIDRVLDGISGLDDQPLTPPELCPDLDLPAWQLLRDHAKDWLLPGAQQLPEDSVVAVETNPGFVDAFLLGLNTQTLGELRFRNIPIRAGCTPLRQFWARADVATGTYLDDIIGVHNWPATSALGSTAHQTPAAASADLVVVFHSPLFRRYPATIVYLAPAPLVGGDPDWDGEPDLTVRLEPAFQGSITPDITFFGFDLEPAAGARHWVVLEEPPRGFQFFNATHDPDGDPMPGFDPARIAAFNGATDGAAFADAAFADPYRVMIRGEALI